MHSITYFKSTEYLVNSLLKNIGQEITNSKNLLYKPIIICPNVNFQNYITKFMADSSIGQISMGIELLSIEEFLKKILAPNEILLNEKILGLEILNLFQENSRRYENLRKIFENEKISRKNRFDLAFSIAYRLIKYQRELGSNWKFECTFSLPYGEEQISLIDDLILQLNSRNKDIQYILPESIPTLIKEREKFTFKKPIHIVGPTNLLLIHIEALEEIKENINLYQLHPYISPPEKINTPFKLLSERLMFIQNKFNISKPLINNEELVCTTNLHSLQNIMKDENFDITKKSDTSIQILISPSIKRELEAVYSDILLNLQKDSTLSPNDFLILVPNLEIYSATVRSVFSMNNLDFSENGKKFYKILSFIITDEAAGKKSSLTLAINDFFQLGLSGALNRRNVSTLLRHTNIQIPLGIQPEDTTRIANWFNTYSFLKSISPEEISVGEIQRDVHSFKYFLKKIRMGIFFPPSHEDILVSKEEVIFHPSGNPNREDLILLEKLHKAEEFWTEWIESCKQETISIDLFLSILEKNIQINFSNSSEIFLYHKLKTKLLEVENAEYRLHPEELYFLVMNILENDKDTQETILENGVTISPILPVRPIPFKYVYMLGLNKGSFGINPEKSPYDLFFGEKTKSGFQVINSQQLAGIMLQEAIFSARTQLVFGMVAEESTEKIKEILSWLSNNSEQVNHLKLSSYHLLTSKDNLINPGRKISEILSESGVVLGGLLEFLQNLQLSIPINLIPLSRYSRFYFQENLNLPGSFLIQKIEKSTIAVTNLYRGNEKSSIDEREYLYLFHDTMKKVELNDTKLGREIHSRVNLKTLIQFLINPLDDFLNSVNYDYEVNPDPNKEFDSMDMSSKDIAKLLLPFIKEGNKTKESIIDYYHEKKSLWIAKGYIPSGNWSISEEYENIILENLLKNFDEEKIKNPTSREFNIIIDNIEVYYKYKIYNEDIIKFSNYSKDFAIKILLPEIFCEAIAYILSDQIKKEEVDLQYLYLDKGSLKLHKYSTISVINTKKSLIMTLLSEVLNEYKKGSLPYSFDKLEINNYSSNISDLSTITNFKADFNPNNSYESQQRDRKKNIIGIRNPFEFPNDDVKIRTHKLLELNKICRELFPEEVKSSKKDKSIESDDPKKDSKKIVKEKSTKKKK